MRAVRKIGEVGDAGRRTKRPTHGLSKDTPLSPINFLKIIKIKNKYPFFFPVPNFGNGAGEGVRYVQVGTKAPSDGGSAPHIWVGRYRRVRLTAPDPVRRPLR